MGAAKSVADTIQPVVSEGLFGTPLTINGLPSWGLFILLVTAFLRSWMPFRKADDARDASLRADLLHRISELERASIEERRACDEKLRSLQAQIDGLLRQIIAMQITTGRPIAFPPATGEAATRLLERIDEATTSQPPHVPEKHS